MHKADGSRASDIWTWDAARLAAAIRAREVSCRDAVQASLDRIAAVNPRVNAVTTVLGDEALAAAAIADNATDRGPLHGVPVLIKENTDQAGQATTNGVYPELIAKADNPVVANLRRAGAIVVGRTNTAPFGSRWDTVNRLRGRTYNPWDAARSAGGSSGGAAAALALGMAPLAHGNDYGGSIRQPAFCCGVAGLRPGFGRVPGFNATAVGERPMTLQLFSSQGPMARRVADLRLALSAMAEGDSRDPWWAPVPLQGPPVAKRAALVVSGHAAVQQALRRAGAALADAGYQVDEVAPPALDTIAELWWQVTRNELREMVEPAMRAVADDTLQPALDVYMSGAPRMDMPGYMRSLASVAGHARAWNLFFDQYPVVIGPVSNEPPPLADFDIASNAEALTRMHGLLLAVNTLGIPALALPVSTWEGLPIGVQVVSRRYREDLCLSAAEVIEQASGFDVVEILAKRFL